jgi:hypothetical protein
VVERLPSKCKALSSSPSTAKKIKTNKTKHIFPLRGGVETEKQRLKKNMGKNVKT